MEQIKKNFSNAFSGNTDFQLIELGVDLRPEVRAALLENGVLQEIFIERTARRGLISNIYNGRVSRVLPGMQAAFVEIGLERTAFLHASDIARNGAAGDAMAEDLPDIRELVREGDRLLVQVVKDPLGNKGARLTTFITLPSRHLVLLPRSTSVGISARIDRDGERERLRLLVEELLAEHGLECGAIVRTVAEGAGRESLEADLEYLVRLWGVIQERCSNGGVQHLVNEDLSLTPEAWQESATFQDGSWWPRWESWLKRRSGAQIPAREPGDSQHPPLAPAPGTYVASEESL